MYAGGTAAHGGRIKLVNSIEVQRVIIVGDGLQYCFFEVCILGRSGLDEPSKVKPNSFKKVRGSNYSVGCVRK